MLVVKLMFTTLNFFICNQENNRTIQEKLLLNRKDNIIKKMIPLGMLIEMMKYKHA